MVWSLFQSVGEKTVVVEGGKGGGDISGSFGKTVTKGKTACRKEKGT